jgi:hypothetical protein
MPLMDLITIGRENTFTLLRGMTRGMSDVASGLAAKAVTYMHEFFRTGGPTEQPWQKLSEMTIEKKTRQEPLILTGRLEDSIGARKIDPYTWEFGVYDPRAGIHEFGAIVNVTPAMRVYLASIGFPLRRETTVLTIPARPIVRPAADRIEREADAYAKERMTFWQRVSIKFKHLMGRLGR